MWIDDKSGCAANTGLAKVAAQCSAAHFWLIKVALRISICGENRHLRQALSVIGLNDVTIGNINSIYAKAIETINISSSFNSISKVLSKAIASVKAGKSININNVFVTENGAEFTIDVEECNK